MLAVALAAVAMALLARRVRLSHCVWDVAVMVARDHATRIAQPPSTKAYLTLDGTDFYVPTKRGFQLLYDANSRSQGADRYDWAIAVAGLAVLSAAAPAVRRGLLALVPRSRDLVVSPPNRTAAEGLFP